MSAENVPWFSPPPFAVGQIRERQGRRFICLSVTPRRWRTHCCACGEAIEFEEVAGHWSNRAQPKIRHHDCRDPEAGLSWARFAGKRRAADDYAAWVRSVL
jgi:hypothetical protein